MKIAAHTTVSLAVAWHPNREWVLATGSRDRTVKIWDLNATSTADDNVNSVGISSGAGASGGPLKPIHLLYTPTTVGRVAWRPMGYRSTNGHVRELLATTSTAERGDIAIWDIRAPNIPTVILRGHTDACMGFAWLDTPVPEDVDPAEIASSSSPIRDDAANPPSSPSRSPTRERERGMSSSSSTASSMWLIGRRGSSVASLTSRTVAGSRSPRRDVDYIDDDINTYPIDELGRPAPGFLGVYQHILSVGKDGKCIVQDLRNGYFPRQHLSRTVASISSRGHMAFQRSDISRVSRICFGNIIKCTVGLPFYC
jgi:WD40 repeat protein